MKNVENKLKFLIYLVSAMFVAGITLKTQDQLTTTYSLGWNYSMELSAVTLVAHSMIWLTWFNLSSHSASSITAKAYWWLCVAGSMARSSLQLALNGALTVTRTEWDMLVVFLALILFSGLFLSIMLFAVSYPLQLLFERILGPKDLLR